MLGIPQNDKPSEFKQHLGQERTQINSRDGSRMSQSLKSPSADSLKVQGGAGILRVLRNSNWIFNTSYFIPNKVLKNPTIPVPPHEDLQNNILCLLPPGAGVEGVQRKVLQGSSQQLKPNQTKPSGLGLWELLLRIQCPPQGHPKLLAGSVPNPHARSGQAVPPNPCVHAGAGISTQGTQFHGLSVPAGTPRAQPYTNSVKSSTEEISLFLCPVS